MADPIIQTIGLKKQYGTVEAVGGLSLTVPRGSIYGFLGRNGAGKTTTIKMLLGMVRPSAGHGRVLGLPIDQPRASAQIRSRTGFVSEEKDIYDYMTVGQLIRFTRPFFPGWRADLEEKLLGLFELPLNRKTRALSKGMRTRLALLVTLARGAELLILDEPTEGLDPAAVEEILQVLVGLASSGAVTVFFSSHQIAEIDQIADHLCIIDRGRAVVDGALDELKESYRRVVVTLVTEATDLDLRIEGVKHVRQDGRAVSVLASHNVDAVVARAQAWKPLSVEIHTTTLKEIFLECVKDQ